MNRKFTNKVFAKVTSFSIINSILLKNSKAELSDQLSRFANLNLDRDKAVDKLNNLFLRLFNCKYSENIGMWSEHLVIMAAISDSEFKVDNILEIGTFDGKTAQVLSNLFPESKITTIDLPSTTINQKQIYNYAYKENNLEIARSLLLEKCDNVEFKALNSLSLVYENSKYDLIWVDGAHGYPTVAIDLINALRLISPRGIVMCDDVHKFTKSNDSEYSSVAAFETLEELRKAELIDFKLFLKRINKAYNYPKSRKKYVGVFQKK